jgi:hypothetical protein
VPVEYGDIITKVNWIVGNTAASTPTHQFSALYSGIATTPALIGQSTDSTTTVVAAKTILTHTLTAPQLITPALAPNGYIYATLSFTGTAYPSLATVAAGTTNLTYQWFTTAPLFNQAAMSHGSAVGGTAPTTIASASVVTTTPVVFLT